MFFSRLPPPTENTKTPSSCAQPAALQPGDEHRLPALVVGARRQLRHVVGRRVGLEAGELAEVVDGVRAVAGAAADAEEEQPAAARAHVGEDVGHPLDASAMSSSARIVRGFVEMLSCVASCRRRSACAAR